MDLASHVSLRIGWAVSSRLATRSRLVHAVLWLERVFRTARERRQLMALDERALKDIGLNRADAHGEWSRPFWDIPQDR